MFCCPMKCALLQRQLRRWPTERPPKEKCECDYLRVKKKLFLGIKIRSVSSHFLLFTAFLHFPRQNVEEEKVGFKSKVFMMARIVMDIHR